MDTLFGRVSVCLASCAFGFIYTYGHYRLRQNINVSKFIIKTHLQISLLYISIISWNSVPTTDLPSLIYFDHKRSNFIRNAKRLKHPVYFQVEICHQTTRRTSTTSLAVVVIFRTFVGLKLNIKEFKTIQVIFVK